VKNGFFSLPLSLVSKLKTGTNPFIFIVFEKTNCEDVDGVGVAVSFGEGEKPASVLAHGRTVTS